MWYCAFHLFNYFLENVKNRVAWQGGVGGNVGFKSFVSRLVCSVSALVYSLLFSLFFFIIIGIIPLHATYKRKTQFYPNNFVFPFSKSGQGGRMYIYIFLSLLFSWVFSIYFFIAIIQICFGYNAFCKFMYQHFISRYFFLMRQSQEKQSHSLPVILTYLIFLTTTSRLDVFTIYKFFFYLRIVSKSNEKNGTMGLHFQRRFR